jgi:hypothetical protein
VAHLRLKQPTSDNALHSLSQTLDFAQDKLSNCVAKGHDILAVNYLSTYTITPNVAYNGVKILDRVCSFAKTSPDCVCLVRTPSHNTFAKVPWFCKQQKKAINSLRKNCYIVQYSKNELVNHAKFLVCYNVCFSETIIHYAEYFGSTNLTQSGLGKPRNKGNYEEFVANKRPKYSLNNGDLAFLEEVAGLVAHKSSLYTDRKYLSANLENHIQMLEDILRRTRIMLNQDSVKKSRGLLFDIYADTELKYTQTIALLDDIPGRKITESINSQLIEDKIPASPLELEMIMGETECSELTASTLDLSIGEIIEKINDNVVVLSKTQGLLRDYIRQIDSITQFLDEEERVMNDYIRQNSHRQISQLSRAPSFGRNKEIH